MRGERERDRETERQREREKERDIQRVIQRDRERQRIFVGSESVLQCKPSKQGDIHNPAKTHKSLRLLLSCSCAEHTCRLCRALPASQLHIRTLQTKMEILLFTHNIYNFEKKIYGHKDQETD